MMYLVQKVAPINEVVSLEKAKEFMRVLEDDQNDVISSMILSATDYASNYTNRQFITATYELYTEIFKQDMQLPKNPIQSITSVEYMDENGVYQPMTDFYVYGENGVSKIHFEDMPTHKEHKNAIRITFVAGYGDNSTDVPSAIISFILVMTSTLYENREQYVVGVSIDTMANPILDKMLMMYKVRAV